MAGVDRISHLPDEIIHHILSFLRTTKLRAQTSVLSKRWREIWTHHPSLHISVTDSGGGDIVAGDYYISAVVCCVLSFKSPSLHQLSVDLWFPSSESATSLYQVISDGESRPPIACATASHLLLQFAGRRSVHNLQILVRKEPTPEDDYSDEDNSPIPDSLYCCTSLVDLEIISGTFPTVPEGFHGFRCLKSLNLQFVMIDTDELGYLLGCCDRLETVRISRCRGFTFFAVAPLNLPELTDLIVHSCEDLKEASVEATHLESIVYEGDLQHLELYTSPVLYEAALCQDTRKAFDTQECFMSIIFAIENASVLVANDWFYQFVISEPGGLYNLKELTLYINKELTESSLKVLITNIGECPKLETLDMIVWSQPDQLYQDSLTYHGSPPHLKYSNALLKFLEENDKQDWRNLPELVPNRSLPNLKTVIMRQFLGSKSEMHLVKFLLRNGVALEKFLIFDFVGHGKEKLEELFAPFPNASSQVQLKRSVSENSFLLMSHSWLFLS